MDQSRQGKRISCRLEMPPPPPPPPLPLPLPLPVWGSAPAQSGARLLSEIDEGSLDEVCMLCTWLCLAVDDWSGAFGSIRLGWGEAELLMLVVAIHPAMDAQPGGREGEEGGVHVPRIEQRGRRPVHSLD